MDARLTLDGRRVLDGPPDDLTSIRALLREGDVTRALIDLVEGVISDFVDEVATSAAVDMADRAGQGLTKIRQRVDRLGTVGTLDKVDVAILRVALEARNHVGHSITDKLSADINVAWIVDGVEGVLERCGQGVR
jgi:hypothetical protein